MTFFTIIIPCKNKSKLLAKTINKLNKQLYKNFETIVLPDKPIKKIDLPNLKNLKIISTGEVPPGIKRDVGSKYSNGKFLVFLDDDSYPSQKWLQNAKNIIFKNKNIKCFGGSSILPNDDNEFSKVCDYIFRISPSNISLRYGENKKIKSKVVKDWPTVNLFICKKIFQKINGFSNYYWPGEDTILCRKLLLNKIKIFYFNNLHVFHYRRSDIRKYTNQISRYGVHRGFFAKKYPENSGLIYFVPLFFILIMFFLTASGFINLIYSLFLIFNVLIMYLIYINFKFFLIKGKIKYLFYFNLGCLFTHLIYGIYFLKGFFSKKLPKFKSR
tara:strand:- start:711 stop:1694 length:984 start_codon:yes stop_codon:yes gene_type:complete